MGTISNTVQLRMENFRQAQMRCDELTQRGWGDAADNFCERDMQYRMTQLAVSAVVMPETGTTAVTPSVTTYGELVQVLDIVLRQSEMPQVISSQGSSEMRLGSEKPQANNHIVSVIADEVLDSSPREIAMPVCPVSKSPSV